MRTIRGLGTMSVPRGIFGLKTDFEGWRFVLFTMEIISKKIYKIKLHYKTFLVHVYLLSFPPVHICVRIFVKNTTDFKWYFKTQTPKSIPVLNRFGSTPKITPFANTINPKQFLTG